MKLHSTYPISDVCPQCGSTAYKRVKAQTDLPIKDDRVCTDCGTRYTPPTPFWARMVLVGLAILSVVGLGAAAIFMLQAEPPQMRRAIYCGVGGLGAAAIFLIYGSCTKIGRLVPAERNPLQTNVPSNGIVPVSID